MKKLALVGVLTSNLFFTACTWDEMVGQMQASFTEPVGPQAVSADQPANANAIPWQLTPASAASRAQGEQTIVADVPSVGRVRGTEKAIAEWHQKLVPYTEDDKVVTACRGAFEPQAKRAGAYFVEAAAAGPKRKIADGWTQQVFFRILYSDAQDSGVEVRQASIACTTDQRGVLKKAVPI